MQSTQGPPVPPAKEPAGQAVQAASEMEARPPGEEEPAGQGIGAPPGQKKPSAHGVVPAVLAPRGQW